MHENEIARQIVDTAYNVHVRIGPGLLESVYERVMQYELEKLGLKVDRQRGVPSVYEEIRMPIGFRADLVVNNKVVIEIKSVEALAPVHAKQLRTYLIAMEMKLGLLINFNTELIKHGIKRVVNGLEEP
ncbi:MAG: GxxExxY protein [Acidobacteriota bacterium]|nr:MAG: GxxExxY protein [Acidobacteriota bacterium]